MSATENRATIDHVRALLASGGITYEQAKEQLIPVLEAINTKGKAIAKKHGKKYRPITFTGVMR